jgi:hypothetical protein
MDTMPIATGKELLIGWKEYVHFPEWRLPRIKAKIDTGARTSVLDVLSYELCRDDEEEMIAVLRLPPLSKRESEVRVVRTPVQGMARIRNPGGIREERPVIETLIRIGPVTKRVRLTVTNRSGMLFRMILGRTALAGDFIVDVNKKFVLGKK